MSVDLDKLLLHSSYNTLKNNSVQRGNLDLPTSLAAGATWTDTLSFTLSEDPAFIQAYSYASDYGDYFTYLDSAYHDEWRQIHTNNDYLLFSDGGLQYFNIYTQVTGLTITFTLYHKNISASTLTYRHDTDVVPVTFIDYSLAN